MLELLAQRDYPNLVNLQFAEKRLFGYKQTSKGGWTIGSFWMPESSSRGAGHEPLHLLSDGNIAAFGHLELEFDDLDDIWWRRNAPGSRARPGCRSR